MGYIVLTSISFTTTPPGIQVGCVYKLASDPDLPGSYTEAFSDVSFNPNGTIVGGPRTISGLANGVQYTVKVALNCGDYWTKNITVPAATTTTTSTTTTMAPATLTISVCGGVINHTQSLFFLFSSNLDVNTDITINFTVNGTATGGAPRSENLSTVMSNGTYEKVYSGGSSWATMSSITITSITPSSFAGYTYVAGTYTGNC